MIWNQFQVLQAIIRAMFKSVISKTQTIKQSILGSPELLESYLFQKCQYNIRQTKPSLKSIGTQQKLSQQEIDTVKTYLEIIPPHKVSQMVEEREAKLSKLLQKANTFQKASQSQSQDVEASLLSQGVEKEFTESEQWAQQQSLKGQQLQNSGAQGLEQNKKPKDLVPDSEQLETYKRIYKYLKTRLPYTPPAVLSKVVSIVSSPSNPSLTPEEHKYRHKTYLKIVQHIKYNSEALPFEDLVNFVYKLAKLNRRESELMKAAEAAIIEVKLKINYPMLRKILWAYTHLNLGSSVLYSHVTKTIKVGQYELEPLELAEAAYMLSKVSENSKGGYGTFEIAEKHLEANLARMDFSALVKASFFMLTQNIGTNKFQLHLEAEIYKKYPSRDKLKVADLVTLLKATSAYYFKFNNRALSNMLRASSVRESETSTLEQFEDIIWSWGRLVGKGDQELWQRLQAEVSRRINYLKPRQLSFFYYAICCSTHADPQTLTLIEEKFVEKSRLGAGSGQSVSGQSVNGQSVNGQSVNGQSVNGQSVNEHYLVKMLLGMQRLRSYNKELFVRISVCLCSRISCLSKSELIAFIRVLNDSEFDFSTKSEIQSIVDALESSSHKLLSAMYLLKLSEVAEVLYLLIKFELSSTQQTQVLQEKCFSSLGAEILSIPKAAFIKAMFCFTIRDNYERAFQMLAILEDLCQYGPVGYFFAPHEFPLLAYCVLHLNYNSRQPLQIKQQLIRDIQKTLKEIEPAILNEFVGKAFQEANSLIAKNKSKEAT